MIYKNKHITVVIAVINSDAISVYLPPSSRQYRELKQKQLDLLKSKQNCPAETKTTGLA